MGTLGGFALVLAITLVAGGIAYVGDRVGHQVGRKRLTMFGLRPKHTSTIVAVGTGMVIAFTVTVAALLLSGYARAAFFHLSDLNDRVNKLQAEADALDRRARNTNVVVDRGALVYEPYLLISPNQSTGERMALMSSYFDSVVQNVNRNLVPRGLKPFKGQASDPETQAKLRTFLSGPDVAGALLQGPILLIAVADQNLFVNDPIHFSFPFWRDKVIFHAHEQIAAADVEGGTEINTRVVFTQLIVASEEAAIANGMPPYYAQPFPNLSEARAKQMGDEIRAGRGRFHIEARAAQDIYPHTGGMLIEFALSRGTR
jgi:hypothetical protein